MPIADQGLAVEEGAALPFNQNRMSQIAQTKDHGTKTGLDTVSRTKDDVTYQRFSEFVGNDHFRPG